MDNWHSVQRKASKESEHPYFFIYSDPHETTND
jgi:hypothetical protein